MNTELKACLSFTIYGKPLYDLHGTYINIALNLEKIYAYFININ